MSQVIQVQIQPHGLRPLAKRTPFAQGSLWLRLIVLCLPLLTIHCAALQQTDTAAALPLSNALPTDWVALRDVQEVNIDGDEMPEYLLFFMYDSSEVAAPAGSFFARMAGSTTPLGPIGAIIYDAQVVTGTTTTERVSPDRPTNALVPYALLPSYRRGAGQGFIAAPDQGEEVQAYPVSYRGLPQGESAEAAVGADTLIFLGGERYLTFVWWQNRTEGYGVSQIYAPGGFEAALYDDFNWTQWTQNPQPIRQIVAVHPLHDRNLLCRRFRYELASATEGAASSFTGGQPILFQASDLGLHFCASTPAHPFYPEGVVLAYLLEGNAALLDSNNTANPVNNPASDIVTNPLTASGAGAVTIEQGGISWLQQLVERGAVVRVDDLVSYATLSTSPTPLSLTPPDTMMVCATITLQPPATAETSNTAPHQQELLFRLRHQPAQFQPPTPDRLFITDVTIANVEMLAAPRNRSVVNCEELLRG